MKKTMIALAAVLAAGMMYGDVVSENVVGYQNIPAGLGSALVAGTFVPIGNGSPVTLGDVSAKNFDPGSDVIQFLDAMATATITATYLDPTLAAEIEMDAGWWAPDLSECYNDQPLPIGGGFLVTIQSGDAAAFMFNGEVPQTTVAVPVAMGSAIIGNPMPIGLTLADVTAENFDPGSDTIQFLDATATATITATYIDPELAASIEIDAGWWAPDLSDCYNEQSLSAGDAFLVTIQSGDSVVVNFPNPVL